MRLHIALGFLLLSCAVASAAESMRDYDALAMQGDVKAGLVVLERIPADSLGPDERKRRDDLFARFKGEKPPKVDVDAPPLTRDVAEVYLKYWRRCLLREVETAAANAELFADLKACLNKHGKEPGRFSSLNDLTEGLGAMLAAEGVHSLRGVTAPYYELMLWKDQAEHRYAVELPESTEQVRVVFLSRFLLQGWLGFATCDHEHSSGWTTKDALFCVRDSYDPDSEYFRVSYLAHEAQHFADMKRFPKLEQPELEYRAKLVELSRAEESLYPLLESFTRAGGPDRKSPHALANLRATQHLSSALFGDDSALRDPSLWSRESRAEIHDAALNVLRQSTATLQETGAVSVKRYL